MAEEKPQRRDACVPFWGIFFLFLGIVFLLQTLNVLPWGLWRTLGRFWPVILIALGICLVMRRFNVWLVSLIIFALFFGSLGIAYWQYEPTRIEQPGAMSYSEPLDNLKKAQVDIDFAAGNLNLGSLPSGTPNLMEANTRVDFRRQDSEAKVSLSRSGVGWPFWDEGRDRWRVDLAQNVPLVMNAKLDMTNTVLDLSQLQVTELKIDADLTNCNVKIPSSGTTSGYIKVDLTTLELTIPEGVAAKMKIQADLTPLTINERRFPKKGDYYISSDYETARNRVELEIDADLSTVQVR